MRQKGSILIVVLWSLFFLGVLSIAVYACVSPQLSLAAKLKNRAKLYFLAKAGVKRAMLELNKDVTLASDALKESWSNNEDGFKEVELADGMFTITGRPADWINNEQEADKIRYGLIDEERKININQASFAILKNLFELTAQITSLEAGDIAASIVDWRDKDEEPLENGAENGYYLSLEPPYPCKNADFQVLEELLLIKGMNREIFNKVKNEITIYGQGTVNINTGGKLVLRNLGMSESLARKIVCFRSGPDGEESTGDDNVFESVETVFNLLNEAEDLSEEEKACLQSVLGGGLISVRSDNFMGYSFGQIKNRAKFIRIAFVFNRDEGIKEWREE